MKTVIKLFACMASLMFLFSCEREDSIVASLAGTWEYTIEISYAGTNYDTNQTISETKSFSGTFTWDEDLNGNMEGDIEYAYLNGYVEDGALGFVEDSFMWSGNGNEYEAFCIWNSVPVKKRMKSFTTEEGSNSWVEIELSDGTEIFCSDVEATFEARKIR